MKTQPNDTINPIVCDDSSAIVEGGLTKREYFAAMAIQTLVGENTHPSCYRDRANRSVIMADALINALNQPQP